MASIYKSKQPRHGINPRQLPYSRNNLVEMDNVAGGDCMFLAFAAAFSHANPTNISNQEARLRACRYIKQNTEF